MARGKEASDMVLIGGVR